MKLANMPQGTSCFVDANILFGDALIVAIMRDQGLTQLASLDPDFDNLPGLTRYAPA